MNAKILMAAMALALVPLASKSGPPQNLNGDWFGEVDGGDEQTPLVLHVGSEIRLDSPSRGMFGILGDVEQRGDRVNMVFATGGAFEGVLRDGDLQGAYLRGPASLPVVFRRRTWAARLRTWMNW